MFAFPGELAYFVCILRLVEIRQQPLKRQITLLGIQPVLEMHKDYKRDGKVKRNKNSVWLKFTSGFLQQLQHKKRTQITSGLFEASLGSSMCQCWAQ